MIEGIHFDITSEEMKVHLAGRASHHIERAAYYQEQQVAFADVPGLDSSSNDPVRGLKEAGKRHAQKAELFTFMAAHVPPDEVYRLGSQDLYAVELISERGFS